MTVYKYFSVIHVRCILVNDDSFFTWFLNTVITYINDSSNGHKITRVITSLQWFVSTHLSIHWTKYCRLLSWGHSVYTSLYPAYFSNVCYFIQICLLQCIFNEIIFSYLQFNFFIGSKAITTWSMCTTSFFKPS